MTDGVQLVEIILLAMLAGFIALRLVSVLGRRTGDEKPLADPQPHPRRPRTGGHRDEVARPREGAEVVIPANVSGPLVAKLQEIAQADPSFDPSGFLSGSREAYRMILEAFWAADLDALKPFVSDEIYEQFAAAIAQRKADGITLDNRLIAIDSAALAQAELNGSMAEVTVRFDAQLAAVTRNSDGQLIAGSETDSVETHDLWTFSRHISSPDPNWLLIETDSDS